MENRIQTFHSEEFGEIRTFFIENQPWFIGAEVAKALGYQNVRDAIAKHVDAEDRNTVAIRDGMKGNPNKTVINESGLYSLILSSKLESAKRFKRWVTSEVLPSIRRHGAYMTDALLEQAAGNADVAAQVVRVLSEERNLNRKLACQLKQAEAQLTEALPKAAYFDALVDCPDCTGIRLTAKELGVPQSIFTAYLVRKKYAYYDAKGIMHPHALPYRNGLVVVREYIAPNGHRGTQMLVTPRGKQVFLAERSEIIG